MSSRIAEELPGLPEPGMEKLLEVDAGDLDLMIQNPLALQGQVRQTAYCSCFVSISALDRLADCFMSCRRRCTAHTLCSGLKTHMKHLVA